MSSSVASAGARDLLAEIARFRAGVLTLRGGQVATASFVSDHLNGRTPTTRLAEGEVLQ